MKLLLSSPFRRAKVNLPGRVRCPLFAFFCLSRGGEGSTHARFSFLFFNFWCRACWMALAYPSKVDMLTCIDSLNIWNVWNACMHACITNWWTLVGRFTSSCRCSTRSCRSRQVFSTTCQSRSQREESSTSIQPSSFSSFAWNASLVCFFFVFYVSHRSSARTYASHASHPNELQRPRCHSSHSLRSFQLEHQPAMQRK